MDSANKAGTKAGTKKRKAPPHAFKPGQSGNPNGRPKVPKEFRELAKANSTKALEIIIEIMKDPKSKPGDRLRAAEMIMDRAWGKPKQGLELTGEDGGPIQFGVVALPEVDEDG